MPHFLFVQQVLLFFSGSHPEVSIRLSKTQIHGQITTKPPWYYYTTHSLTWMVKKKKARSTKKKPRKVSAKKSQEKPKHRGKGEVVRVSVCSTLLTNLHSSALDCDLSGRDIPISFQAANSVFDLIASKVTTFSKLLVERSLETNRTSASTSNVLDNDVLASIKYHNTTYLGRVPSTKVLPVQELAR